jgi:hypothetical protein
MSRIGWGVHARVEDGDDNEELAEGFGVSPIRCLGEEIGITSIDEKLSESIY